MICSLYIQSLKTTRLWRSFQTLWMSCRNITVKSLPLPRLNILRLLSDLFACLLSLPNPFSWCRSWECHTDSVHLGAVSLRCGKVAWELPGLSGTSEGGAQGSAQVAALLPRAMEGWSSLGCWPSSVLPTCSHLCLLLQSRRPIAGLQNHSILSAVEIAEQKTMCGNCGYRKWSTTTAFTFRLFDW